MSLQIEVFHMTEDGFDPFTRPHHVREKWEKGHYVSAAKTIYEGDYECDADALEAAWIDTQNGFDPWVERSRLNATGASRRSSCVGDVFVISDVRSPAHHPRIYVVAGVGFALIGYMPAGTAVFFDFDPKGV